LITEHDLHEAIAECQGSRSPNANTCVKLASYYTILDHINKDKESNVDITPTYSFASAPAFEAYSSKSEFGTIVKDIDYMDCMTVLDEMMETMRIIVPKLYDAVMRKLTALK